MIQNKTIIVLLVVMIIMQFVFLWLPIGNDGVHGLAFMGSKCTVHPKNLETVVSLGAAGLGLSTLSLFKMKNPAFFGFTMLMILALNVMMITQVSEYISFHHNVCHEMPLDFNLTSCNGPTYEYSITRRLPWRVILVAIAAIITDIYSRKSKYN